MHDQKELNWYQLIPSRDIDDQRILESDWPESPRVVVLNATFSWLKLRSLDTWLDESQLASPNQK